MNLEVEVAEDGRRACQMAQESQTQGRPYDLILMDIQMPEMNGLEATRSLRRHDWKGPIVALTAHALVGDREKCLEAGCNDYVTKPITTAGLSHILTRYLPGAQTPSRSAPDRVSGSTRLLLDGVLAPSKIAKLMDAFRQELPARADRIRQAFQQQDRMMLLELAHQLKGSAGTYGFGCISEAADAVCGRLRADDPLEAIQAVVDELVDLCGAPS
jgi:CheY-like chemotaxis protein/HPt (histidine-containing phosphotransfer) domain-containing protein